MPLEIRAARFRQRVPGHRPPVAEALLYLEVASVLELATVGTQAAVRLFENLLEAAERHGVVFGKQNADREADAVFEQRATRSRPILVS